IRRILIKPIKTLHSDTEKLVRDNMEDLDDFKNRVHTGDELEELGTQRRTARAARDRSGITRAAIVGYTNAGKSTLLNRLTDAGILAEDKLFATLDPTTRKFVLPCGETVLLTDTVGFIRNLPHHLIKAFSSTLEEAATADIIIIIVDASDPDHPSQLEVTRKLLSELGAGARPTMTVYNKCDREADRLPDVTRDAASSGSAVFISALTGEGIDDFSEMLQSLVRAGRRRERYLIPLAEAGLLSFLYRDAEVESAEYGSEYIDVTAIADERVRGLMSKYLAGG
ncbi:MAG: GTPase HflX, partial [Clostridia bacterium]|nr:GTPase HflX [Clostridia bacterium]